MALNQLPPYENAGKSRIRIWDFFCFVNLTALSLLIQLAFFAAIKEVVGKMRFSWPKFLHGNYRMAGTVRREVLTILPSIIYVKPFHKIDYNWGH
jgi:hypothetical protein